MCQMPSVFMRYFFLVWYPVSYPRDSHATPCKKYVRGLVLGWAYEWSIIIAIIIIIITVICIAVCLLLVQCFIWFCCTPVCQLMITWISGHSRLTRFLSFFKSQDICPGLKNNLIYRRDSMHVTLSLYRKVQKVFQYVEPFRCWSRVWQTDWLLHSIEIRVLHESNIVLISILRSNQNSVDILTDNYFVLSVMHFRANSWLLDRGCQVHDTTPASLCDSGMRESNRTLSEYSPHAMRAVMYRRLMWRTM